MMNKKNDDGNSDQDTADLYLDELPPLDRDDINEKETEEMASFLFFSIDDESKESKITEADENNISSNVDPIDLISWPAQSSFVEESEEHIAIEPITDLVNENEDWTGDDSADQARVVENWFDYDDDRESLDQANDCEGPTSEKIETFEIDENSWDNIDNEPADLEEETLEVMERLGIHLSNEDSLDVDVCAPIIDIQFLGPKGREIKAVTFAGGSPIAAGDGLFVLGADGMFHDVWSEGAPAIHATSIFARDSLIFLGTTKMGALLADERGQLTKQLNTWYTQGLPRGVYAASDQISISFKIYGQKTSKGYRLLGCTESGQLFSSMDSGKTWRNLAIPGKCIAFCTEAGGSAFFTVTLAKEGNIGLWQSKNADDWHAMPLPNCISAHSSLPLDLHMAAAGKTLIIGANNLSIPVAVSFDSGDSWHLMESLLGASAVALDPDNPSCMAVASRNTNKDTAAIHVSEDQGLTWRRVMTLAVDETDRNSYIEELVIRTGRTREIVAATSNGVYLITLTLKGISH